MGSHVGSRSFVVWFCVAALCSLAVAGGITNVDRGQMEEVLDAVSKDVQKKFYDPKLKGLDWKALTEKSRERIRKAETTGEMISAIYALLYQLNDSHTVFIPPGRTEKAVYGFEAKPFGEDVLVYKLTKGGSAENAGLLLGDRIVGVDGFATNRANFFTMMRYFQVLNPATEMDIDVVRRGSAPMKIKVPTKLEAKWAHMEFNTWTYNEIRREIDSGEPAFSYATYSGDIAYLRLRTFLVSYDDIASAMNKVKDCRALILDLRGNSGGSLEALSTLAGSFTTEPYEMGRMVFREKSQPIKVKPVHPNINVPVFVLVDSNSASASEMFARIMQLRKRATIMGDNTSGRVNVAEVFPESIGIEFKVYFAVEIAVARAVMQDGEELEGVGVKPDSFCIPATDDLRHEKDPCLDRSVTLARASLGNSHAEAQP